MDEDPRGDEVNPVDYHQPLAQEPHSHHESVSPGHPRASYQRFMDLLRDVAEVHAKLSAFYGRLGVQAERPKSKILLEFMRDHEQSVRRCIEEFEAESDSEALEAWFQYAPAMEPDRWIEEIEFRPDMSDEDVAEIIAHIDNMLTDAFEQLADRARPARLREALESFAQLEQRAKIRALRATEID